VVLSDEAVAAVRAIGPKKAIPTLLAWLRTPDSSIRQGAKIVLEWELKLPLHVPTNHDKRERVMWGFRALGPAVTRSAFPEIVAIYLGSPDEWQRRCDAYNVLIDADADTMRLFAEALKSPDPEVRLRAVEALSSLRIAPDEVGLPALEGAQNDPDPRVRAEVAKAIALYKRSLNAYATSLNDPDPRNRTWRARRVGEFRTRARAFLPALEAIAHDPDPEVRKAVAEAIRQVRGPQSSPTD
jgi:HEAT repeat protein